MRLRGGTVRAYLAALRDAASVPGATEPTLRPPLVDFLHAAVHDLELAPMTVHPELRLRDVGQPDLQVVDGLGSPIGYGETKPIGSAAVFARVLESEQIERYRRSIDNLLVTDFLRFSLFRADLGRLDVVLLESEARLVAGVHTVSAAQLGALENLLQSFFSARSPIATSAEQLAGGLARKTTLLRDAIRALLGTPGDDGEALRRLHEFYRRSLMSDMTDDDFADTYAQTLVYALFLARLEGGPVRDLDAALAAIPRDVPILRSAIEPLRVAGRLPDPVATWLGDALVLLAATPDAVIGSIGHPSAGMPDPILYFYEHFLAAYDRLERIRKGVYYTPRPLVDYLVRAVDDSLVRDFGRAAGLGDTGVSVLDPAVGTGTFILAAAQQALANVTTSLGSGAVQAVLDEHILRDFYGFELLPAPYTIAHVKLALFAREHHASFRERRARIYLTNTLGDPLARADDGGLLAFFVPGLIEEAAEAERVKSDQQILVIVGNPPYSAASHNKQPEIERIFAAWKTIDGRAGSPPIREAQIALNDDYLKFMRWAVWKLLEQPGAPGHGILAFVTNHGFVWNRLHRGVRKALLDAFDDIWVFNLQGNQRLWVRGRTDEKVFPEVQQGIALSVFVRRPGPKAGLGTVHYREMRGTRQAKYDAASTVRLCGTGWTTVAPEAPYWSFAPSAGDDRYATWPSVPELFPVNSSGVQTSHDDLVVDTDRTGLEEHMRLVENRSIPDEELAERFEIADNPRWRWSEHRAAFVGLDPSRIIRFTYRLFDRRFVYWDPVFVQWPRRQVMRHLLPRPFGDGGEDRLALVVQRARPIGTIATITRGIATAHVTGQWCHVYPLHTAAAAAEGTLFAADAGWRENLDPTLAAAIRASAGGDASVETIAAYVLAVLSAPQYRRLFSAPLEIDHPRIPFPANAHVFAAMSALGAELAAAHLLEAPVTADIRFEGEGSNRVEEARHDAASNAVWINATQRFTGVPEAAWAWGGAFRPLEHWLTDRRGRTLDLAQLEQFQRAIHTVREAIRLEPLLDEHLGRVLGAPLAFAAAE
jgi:hypothetical protein